MSTDSETTPLLTYSRITASIQRLKNDYPAFEWGLKISDAWLSLGPAATDGALLAAMLSDDKATASAIVASTATAASFKALQEWYISHNPNTIKDLAENERGWSLVIRSAALLLPSLHATLSSGTLVHGGSAKHLVPLVAAFCDAAGALIHIRQANLAARPVRAEEYEL